MSVMCRMRENICNVEVSEEKYRLGRARLISHGPPPYTLPAEQTPTMRVYASSAEAATDRKYTRIQNQIGQLAMAYFLRNGRGSGHSGSWRNWWRGESKLRI